MFEDKILEEVECCIQNLKRHSGTPFNPAPVFLTSVANVIVYILSGKHYDYDDQVFIHYLTFLTKVPHLLGNSAINDAFPFLR